MNKLTLDISINGAKIFPTTQQFDEIVSNIEKIIFGGNEYLKSHDSAY